MPMYHYRCDTCGHEVTRLFKAKQQPEKLPCTMNCPGAAVRSAGAPTTKIVEVRDNGLMGRKVEQLADAERLFRERSQIPESKFRKF